MADELIENAEFGRKRKDEEEPILVAQRYLNIFRQMHIFNKERQAQFDDMLMELQPDVRILLSTLPGGSLLLEHIEELEQKRGLISPQIKKDGSMRKKIGKDLADNASGNGERGNKSSGGVIIDSSFATELSSSLSLALQQTEKRYKDDIKTLTETITQSIMASQTAIANMMKDVLIAARNKNFSGNDNVSTKTIAAEHIAQPTQPLTSATEQPHVLKTDDVKTNEESTEIKSVIATSEMTEDKTSDIKPVVENQSDTKTDNKKLAANVQKTATDETGNTLTATPQTEETTADSSGKEVTETTKPDTKTSTALEPQTTESDESENAKTSTDTKKKGKNAKTESATGKAAGKSIFFQATRPTDGIAEDFPEKNPPHYMLETDNNLIPSPEKQTDEKEPETKEKTVLNLGRIGALAGDLAKKAGKFRKNKKNEEATAKIVTEEKPVNESIESTPAAEIEPSAEQTVENSAVENSAVAPSDAPIADETNVLSVNEETFTEDKNSDIIPAAPLPEAETVSISEDRPLTVENTQNMQEISEDILTEQTVKPETEDEGFELNDTADNTLAETSDNAIDFDSIFNNINDASPDNAARQEDSTLYADELDQIRQALQDPKPQEAPTENKEKNPSASKSEDKNPLPEAHKMQPIPALSDDLVSLDDLPDTPISLDDISEEPISLDDFDHEEKKEQAASVSSDTTFSNPSDEQDWEWEYVDENDAGGENADDWEWEYVEDDGNTDDSEDWEWEYVEDDGASDEGQQK